MKGAIPTAQLILLLQERPSFSVPRFELREMYCDKCSNPTDQLSNLQYPSEWNNMDNHGPSLNDEIFSDMAANSDDDSDSGIEEAGLFRRGTIAPTPNKSRARLDKIKRKK